MRSVPGSLPESLLCSAPIVRARLRGWQREASASQVARSGWARACPASARAGSQAIALDKRRSAAPLAAHLLRRPLSREASWREGRRQELSQPRALSWAESALLPRCDLTSCWSGASGAGPPLADPREARRAALPACFWRRKRLLEPEAASFKSLATLA